jgi:hypothetical protein
VAESSLCTCALPSRIKKSRDASSSGPSQAGSTAGVRSGEEALERAEGPGREEDQEEFKVLKGTGRISSSGAQKPVAWIPHSLLKFFGCA